MNIQKIIFKGLGFFCLIVGLINLIYGYADHAIATGIWYIALALSDIQIHNNIKLKVKSEE